MDITVSGIQGNDVAVVRFFNFNVPAQSFNIAGNTIQSFTKFILSLHAGAGNVMINNTYRYISFNFENNSASDVNVVLFFSPLNGNHIEFDLIIKAGTSFVWDVWKGEQTSWNLVSFAINQPSPFPAGFSGNLILGQ